MNELLIAVVEWIEAIESRERVRRMGGPPAMFDDRYKRATAAGEKVHRLVDSLKKEPQ